MKCFECESDKEIQQHHVIPKSLGGIKTIPLCLSCHNIVHKGIGRLDSHSKLVSKGSREAHLKSKKIKISTSKATPENVDVKIAILGLNGFKKILMAHLISIASNRVVEVNTKELLTETSMNTRQLKHSMSALIKRGFITPYHTKGTSNRVYLISQHV